METVSEKIGRVATDKLEYHDVSILSEAECERIREDLFEMREHWTKRDETIPFYTLGVASYLDATQGRFAEYQEKVQALNPLLTQRFAWLYDRLTEALADYCGEPCTYDDSLARPGFHIFISDKAFASKASVHYDLQTDNVDWSEYEVDLSRQLSLTLSIRLPESGGGLNVWNLNDAILNQMPADERKRCMTENRQPTYHPYSLGGLVVHSGHFLHQIARVKNAKPDDERITLQAHAQASRHGWILYW